MNEKKVSRLIRLIMTMLLMITIYITVFSASIVFADEVYDTNLLVNGSFADKSNGWTLSGDLGKLYFEKAEDWSFPTLADSTDYEGWIVFYYPEGVGSVSLSQVVDLTDYTSSISSGTVGLRLAGYVSRFMSVSTNKIKLQLLDESNNPIPGEEYETMGNNEDGNMSWEQVMISLDSVNPNTRSVRVTLEATVNYSDNVLSDYIAYEGIELKLNQSGLIYSGDRFSEATANDGSISTEIIVTLKGDTFTEGSFTKGVHYTTSNLPDDLTLLVTRNSSTQVTLSLEGNALVHESVNDVSNFTINFLNAAFNGGNAADIENSTKNDLIIDFADAPVITYSEMVFREADANNGSILTKKNILLSGENFAAGPFIKNTHYRAYNVPDGLTMTVTRDSALQVTIGLSGAATRHNSRRDVSNLTIEFLDAAFTNVAASRIINSVNDNMVINFINPALSFMPGVFNEAPANNGSVLSSKVVTLVGDTFVAELFEKDTHYTTLNVPTGMTLVVTRDSDTQVTLSLSGNAEAHEDADDVYNLTIAFLDDAFTKSDASEVANATKNDMVIDFKDAPVLTYTDEIFTEVEANDGTVSITKVVTLTNDEFVAGPFAENTHFTTVNVPTGMTIVVTRDSATQVTISLTGAATDHNDADDVTNLTIEFLDAAFSNAVAAGVINSVKNDMVIDFIDPSLSYEAGAFTEASTNDGSVLTTKTVTLIGDTFVAGTFVENTHYTTSNVPVGLTLTVTRDSATQVTISLTGKATAHEDADDVDNMTITFLDAAFSSSDASEVINYIKNDMVIDFDDAPILTYTAGCFTEAIANDGTVTGSMTVTLTGDDFAAGPFVVDTHYTTTNVPVGMTLLVVRDSTTQVTISLTGAATDHNDADDVDDLTITFLDAAFEHVLAAGVVNAIKDDMVIDFNDPSLSYEAGDFVEAATNYGEVLTTKTVTLIGDTFVAELFVENTHYTTSNVPVGLTLTVTRDSDTQLTLSLTGNATDHEDADDVDDLTITFLDAAFSNSSASEVVNATKDDMVIDFYDAPVLTYAEGIFTESIANDGTVTGVKTVTLTGDDFAAGPFVEDTHYTTANVPAGMSLTVTRDSATLVTISLTGAATNHNDADDVNDLTITFLDAAFEYVVAAGVVNVVKDDMVIDFNDPSLSYEAGSFIEAPANDGSVLTTKTVTLIGDTFVAGPFVENTHYTTSNVPVGLTLTVTRDSATQVTLSLTGNATDHEDADDVSDMAITFLDAAFSNSSTSEVVNATKDDMVIDFNDAPVLYYTEGIFIESIANDGTVTGSKTVTITGDEFAIGPFVESTHFTASNVPAGMSLTVTRDSATQVTISLTGAATNHNDADDVDDLTIEFLDAAFKDALAAGVVNVVKNDMEIDFTDPSLSYSTEVFEEAPTNDGSVLTTKTVTLIGDTFVAGPLAEETHYTTSNVPAGLTLTVTRDNATQVTLSLTGNATDHENADDVADMAITFLDAAFTISNASEVVNFTKDDMVVDFNDAPVLDYTEGIFIESIANDGTVTGSKTVTLTGDEFAIGPFVENTHFTTSNVPVGMSLTVTRDSATQVTISLTGAATNHNDADDMSNLTIEFLDAAFKDALAAGVVNVVKNDMVIDFTDPSLSYEDGIFTEAPANDGSVLTTKTVTLIGDTFVTGPLAEGTHYTTSNVPAGLTLTVTRDNATQVTLSLTGNATDHENADNVSDLTIAFLDATFSKSSASEVVNATKDDMVVDFNDAPVLDYTDGIFIESIANDGTVTGSKTVTITGDEFATGPFVENTHFTTSNVPAGMSLTVTRDSTTQVTISLTGAATNHNDADDVSNLTIEFLDAAFKDALAAGVVNVVKNDMVIDFTDPSLSYEDGIFTEAPANDGSVLTTKTVTLIGDTFVSGPLAEGTHYTTSNVPAGLTLTVSRDSATQVTISLSGNAIAHENADDVVNLTIAFLDAAFSMSDASEVANDTKNDMVIDFDDTLVLTYTTEVFTEVDANDGSVTTTKVVTLTGDTFVAGPFVENTHYTTSNVPAGMTLTVTRDSATQVTLSLSGNATAHENADDVTNLTISFLNAAFTRNNAAIVVNATKDDMVIDFNDAPVLTYAAGIFTESAANDGTIATTKVVILTGDEFATGPFVENTHFTTSNLPAGMSLTVTRDSATQVTLSLTGTATNHNDADDVSNLTIEFLDAAFKDALAAGVVNVVKNDMVIDFADPSLSYEDGIFTEAPANDGSVLTTKTVTLIGDTFVAGPLAEGTHYTTSNVPAGLTLTVTRDSATQVTLSLSGKATAHESANDVTNLTIAFLDAAFCKSDASEVANATKNDMAIDFNDAPVLTYAVGIFTESAANDGTVATTKVVTLTGDEFVAGHFVENTHFTTSNVPVGMSLTVTRNSTSQVTLSLTGTATNHNDADDVSNLTIEFLDAAFKDALAAGVVNVVKNDMEIDFTDPSLSYEDGIFTEVPANDGSVLTTKTVTLIGDTFVAGPLAEGTHYTTSNVPAGMTLTVTRDSTTQVTISLSGKATAHENADDVSDLTIAFLDAAFSKSDASEVANATKNDMAIDFNDALVLTYAAGSFTESLANDGSVATTKVVTLTGDTFVAGPLTEGVHYTTSNVPAGMSLTVTRDSASQVTLSLSGNATSHENSNDVSDLTIEFLNAAFTNAVAAGVINYVKNDMVIDFSDMPLPSVSIDYVTHNEGDTGSTLYTFTVSLSSPAGVGGVTFDIATANNTAEAGTDFVSKSLAGQTIAQGGSSYTFTVTVNGDTTYEEDETFFVNITNVTGANVQDSQGIGTIINDDTLSRTLESIAITTPASKLVYTVGEALDITGMVVTGTYSDGTSEQVTVTLANVTGFSSMLPVANQVLTVNVGGKTTTYTVTIYAVHAEPDENIVTPTPAPKVHINKDGDDIQVQVELTSDIIKYYDGQINIPITSDEILDELEKEERSGVKVDVKLPEQNNDTRQRDINLILESEVIQRAKDNKKDIVVNVNDESDKVLYSWTFDNEELNNSDKDIKDVNLSLSISKAPDDAPFVDAKKDKKDDKDDTSDKDVKDENDENVDDEPVALVIDFAHEGVLPSQASVRIYVGNQKGVSPGTKVYLYHYNDKIKKLETFPYGYQAIVDEEGYITIQVLQCSDYVIYLEEADPKLYVSLRNQIKVTPTKISLSLEEDKDSGKIEIKLPITLEWVKSLKDPTSQSSIGAVTVKFTSSDSKIVEVDTKGNIKAKAPGEAVIKTTITLYSKKTKTVETRVKVSP